MWSHGGDFAEVAFLGMGQMGEDMGSRSNLHCYPLDAVTGTAKGGEQMKIDELELSVRTYNCLKRVGIDTVEKLLTMSDADLMRIRCFGVKCLNEVHEKIRKPYSVTITPEIPGPSNADPNIMELCFHNGERHMKEKIISTLDAFDKDYTLGDPFIEYDKLRKALMDL